MSSVNSATENISQIIKIILTPFAQEGDSFIKDTPDIINVEVLQTEWLFTMDVSGLYTVHMFHMTRVFLKYKK